ncbi:MAG TPA: hypothetical protein VFT22_30615 [Kofleriaceae bacterium]|nr:hypothetical protein [Kofleriaceae bacterium]
MKNPANPRKLMLNTETIAHLRRLANEELGAIRGGLASSGSDPITAAQTDCIKTGR